MTSIYGTVEGDTAWSRLCEFLRRRPNGTYEVRKDPELVAVPSESGAHLNEEQCGGLVRVSGDRFTGFVLDDIADRPNVFAVMADVTDLRLFSRDFSFFNVAIVGETVPIVVLCDTSDFMVYWAAKPVLEVALGVSIEEALGRFDAFVDLPAHSAQTRAGYQRVRDSVARYAAAPPGQWITIP